MGAGARRRGPGPLPCAWRHAVAARRRRPEISTSTRSSPASPTASVEEVILALNATVDGQTTAHYVTELLAGLPVKATQLAHGVPVGGELDYLDEGTLGRDSPAHRLLSMIPKSGYRFSEKIMLKQEVERDDD